MRDSGGLAIIISWIVSVDTSSVILLVQPLLLGLSEVAHMTR